MRYERGWHGVMLLISAGRRLGWSEDYIRHLSQGERVAPEIVDSLFAESSRDPEGFDTAFAEMNALANTELASSLERQRCAEKAAARVVKRQRFRRRHLMLPDTQPSLGAEESRIRRRAAWMDDSAPACVAGHPMDAVIFVEGSEALSSAPALFVDPLKSPPRPRPSLRRVLGLRTEPQPGVIFWYCTRAQCLAQHGTWRLAWDPAEWHDTVSRAQIRFRRLRSYTSTPSFFEAGFMPHLRGLTQDADVLALALKKLQFGGRGSHIGGYAPYAGRMNCLQCGGERWQPLVTIAPFRTTVVNAHLQLSICADCACPSTSLERHLQPEEEIALALAT